MQDQRVSRGKRPLKVFVDSPFSNDDLVVLAKEDCEVVSAWLVAARGRKNAIVLGTNEVSRRIAEFSVVFVSVVEAASVLTQHVREACVKARCRAAALPVTSAVMGKMLGMNRVLVVGVRRDDPAGSELDKFGTIPQLPWLQAVVESKYVPLKFGATESKASEEAYNARAERKNKLAEKIKALKLKRDLQKTSNRQDSKDNKNSNKRQKVVPNAGKSGNIAGKR
jgi:hypothetical protein